MYVLSNVWGHLQGRNLYYNICDKSWWERRNSNPISLISIHPTNQFNIILLTVVPGYDSHWLNQSLPLFGDCSWLTRNLWVMFDVAVVDNMCNYHFHALLNDHIEKERLRIIDRWIRELMFTSKIVVEGNMIKEWQQDSVFLFQQYSFFFVGNSSCNICVCVCACTRMWVCVCVR